MTAETERVRTWTLVAAAAGLAVAVLDETVVFLALPRIEQSLEAGLTGQQWIVNAYLLTLSALLMPFGALADRIGRRRLFIIGGLVFIAASIGAALAPSSAALIGSRAIQGIGAAMMVPTSLALVRSAFAGQAQSEAIGRWAGWGGAAAAFGPLAAGGLMAVFSWRAVFVLEIPVAAFAIAVALAGVNESRDPESHRGADLVGAATAAAALAGLSFTLIEGHERGFGTPAVRVAIAVFLVAFPAFLWRELNARRPMLPLALFRRRNFSIGNAATIALYGAYNGSFFLLMIHLQTAMDYTPLEAGLATVPITLLMIALAGRFGRLAERSGARLPMTLGQALTAMSIGWLALLEPGEDYFSQILPAVSIFGVGLALTVPSLTNTVMSAVEKEHAGLASGVNNLAARLAALLAIAALGLTFSISFRNLLPEPEGRRTVPVEALLVRAHERPSSSMDLSIPEGAEDVERLLEDAFIRSYRVAMFAGAGLSLAGAVVSLLGVRDSVDGSTSVSAVR